MTTSKVDYESSECWTQQSVNERVQSHGSHLSQSALGHVDSTNVLDDHLSHTVSFMFLYVS